MGLLIFGHLMNAEFGDYYLSMKGHTFSLKLLVNIRICVEVNLFESSENHNLSVWQPCFGELSRKHFSMAA